MLSLMLLSGTRSSFSNVFCPPYYPKQEMGRYVGDYTVSCSSCDDSWLAAPPPMVGAPAIAFIGVTLDISMSHCTPNQEMSCLPFCEVMPPRDIPLWQMPYSVPQSCLIVVGWEVKRQASSVKRRDRVTIPKTHVVTSVNKGVLCIFPNRVRPA